MKSYFRRVRRRIKYPCIISKYSDIQKAIFKEKRRIAWGQGLEAYTKVVIEERRVMNRIRRRRVPFFQYPLYVLTGRIITCSIGY